LILNDENKTPVAQFHRQGVGIFGKAQPVSLEMFATGEHMVETICDVDIYWENTQGQGTSGKVRLARI
jgi:hypothetical protein